MTPERQLKRNLRSLTISVAAAGIAVAILVTAIYHTVRRDQMALAARQLEHHDLAFEYLSSIGYGGFIHHFKNWVIRPAEVQYRDAAIASVDRALTLLDRMEQELVAVGITLAPTAQRETLQAYRKMIDVVSEMNAEGADIAETDRTVRISDSSALAEIGALRSALATAMTEQQVRLEDRNLLLYLLPFGLVALTSLIVMALIRQRAQLRFDHDSARIDEMEKFTQIAVHDLRAPLRQITALAEFARGDLDQPDIDMRAAVANHLETILDRADKLDEVVLAIFRYITVEGASQEVSEVDLHALVQSIARTHLPEGASLTMEGEFPTVRAQRVELEIILRNLISNAVKHHPEKRPQIVVRHTRDKRRHCFEVQDDGPGIEEKFAEKVFEMFWSLNARDLPGDVAGVGLALVRRIILKWGTDLSLRNATPNGAVFRFTMPSL